MGQQPSVFSLVRTILLAATRDFMLPLAHAGRLALQPIGDGTQRPPGGGQPQHQGCPARP